MSALHLHLLSFLTSSFLHSRILGREREGAGRLICSEGNNASRGGTAEMAAARGTPVAMGDTAAMQQRGSSESGQQIEDAVGVSGSR